MASTSIPKLPANAPPLVPLNYTLFPKGVITLIDESNLPKDALKQADNAMLYENGSVGPRWGTAYYGSTLPGNGVIDGASSYTGNDGSVQLVVVKNGVVYRSVDNAQSWLTCTGAGVTLTPGKKVTFTQGNQSSSGANYLFINNGNDPIVRFDGTSTLANFVSIPTPTGLTVTPTGFSGTTPYVIYYRVAAVNNIGTTIATPSVTAGVPIIRSAWDPTSTGSKYVSLSWTAVTGAVRYDIYICDNATDSAADNLFYIDSSGTNAYIDRGQTQPNPNSKVPIQDTTTGPILGELSFVGSRLIGTRDKNNKYRVWWTGSGPFLGYFSDAYDGGYIDLQRGSQFFPVHVEDYHDGKATPLITVWCDSSDGVGCIWQGSLDSKTLQNQTYTQPSFNKIPGARGTNAPFSVVNVNNDFVYFNYQAFYNLGARAQFLNLLSTDESSANIRPTLLANINPGAASSAASFYFRAKIFCSLPFNASSNNTTAVYDTERKAWIPYAYTFGMERMLAYTDSNQRQHMLFWKPGDTQLSETSEYILGDYGKGFQTDVTTGLLPVNPRDRFGFMYVEQSEVEFSKPQGNINVELIGIERSRGYSKQKSITVSPQSALSNVGWGTSAWSTQAWDTVSTTTINPYLELSSKKYFNTQRELNAHQWHVSSNSVNSKWLLRELQIQGTYTESGLPRQWRITAV